MCGLCRVSVPTHKLHEMSLPAGKKGLADGVVGVDASMMEVGQRQAGGQGEMGRPGLQSRESGVGGHSGAQGRREGGETPRTAPNGCALEMVGAVMICLPQEQ